MIKLVVSDMDGTLLDDHKKLPLDFFEVLEQLQRNDILFCVASGRQYYTLLEEFFEVRDSIVFCAENGTYVVYKNNVIHLDTMKKTDALQLIEVGRKIENAFLVLCCTNGAYVENTDLMFLNEVKKYYKKLEIVDDLTKVDHEILKVTLCDFGDSEKNSFTYYTDFEKDFKVAISGKIWLDITNLSANKGLAIKKLQNDFNISFNETLVFGDFLNDLEMMQTAKFSYAMKNSHPEILEAASFVTEFSNNESGVTKTIEALCFPQVLPV